MSEDGRKKSKDNLNLKHRSNRCQVAYLEVEPPSNPTITKWKNLLLETQSVGKIYSRGSSEEREVLLCSSIFRSPGKPKYPRMVELETGVPKSTAKIDRRSRKRAPPKLGAKYKKKSHATSGKRDKERQDFDAPYNPILSSSVQEEGKNILDPTLFKKNRSTDTPVGCRYSSAGRARAFSFTLPVLFGQTRHTSPVDGTHGDPIESQHNQTSSEQPENQVASAERVRPLRTVAAAGKQLSIQAENNQYFDGVTPPPTDKSGRGGKGKRQKMSKLSPGSITSNRYKYIGYFWVAIAFIQD
ncbi:hypothetical protein J6590_011919 [Homalodisca vitripennis]|nr:hypothetical protein J6590_011919 [Homalodisca vitripennis]